MRPMACESDDMMLIAPKSCKMSSACIVDCPAVKKKNVKVSGLVHFGY
jgi:hypothetical protein